eukprot:m.4752 g.4752  ORF g.4752 m.4752 type:complete len:410 (-) comp1939_c0_seq1:48-1277(-)
MAMFGQPFQARPAFPQPAAAFAPQPFAQGAGAAAAVALAPGVIHGDKRDEIIQRFSQVQAKFGSGKAFIAKTATQDLQGGDIKSDNPQCLFKGVLFNKRMVDGIGFLVRVPEDKLAAAKDQWIDRLNQIVLKLAEPQTLTDPSGWRLTLNSIMAAPGTNGQGCNVECRTPPGRARQLLAAFDGLAQHPQGALLRPAINELGIVNVLPLNEESGVTFADIPAHIYEESVSQNPDAKEYFAKPVRSVAELNDRFKLQTDVHATIVRQLGSTEAGAGASLRARVNALRSRHAQLAEQLDTMDRRHGELAKRVLRVMHNSQLEAMQQFGARVDAIKKELESDSGLAGTVRRLQAKVAARNAKDAAPTVIAGELPAASAEALKEHLLQQIQGLETVVRVLREDKACLEIVEGRA